MFPTFTPRTPAPTNDNSFAVRPAPYTISYVPDDRPRDPTQQEIDQLLEVTRNFLDVFFTAKYEQTSIIILDDFLTSLDSSDAMSSPVMVTFRSAARFNPLSIFYPPSSEIESEIEIAFVSPVSQLMYLQMIVDELPDGNFFKNTASISYVDP